MLSFRIVIRNMSLKIKLTNSTQLTSDETSSSLHKRKSSIQLNEFILKQSKFKLTAFVSRKISANFAKRRKKKEKNFSKRFINKSTRFANVDIVQTSRRERNEISIETKIFKKAFKKKLYSKFDFHVMKYDNSDSQNRYLENVQSQKLFDTVNDISKNLNRNETSLKSSNDFFSLFSMIQQQMMQLLEYYRQNDVFSLSSILRILTQSSLNLDTSFSSILRNLSQSNLNFDISLDSSFISSEFELSRKSRMSEKHVKETHLNDFSDIKSFEKLHVFSSSKSFSKSSSKSFSKSSLKFAIESKSVVSTRSITFAATQLIRSILDQFFEFEFRSKIFFDDKKMFSDAFMIRLESIDSIVNLN